jgi:hypothetical protein
MAKTQKPDDNDLLTDPRIYAPPFGYFSSVSMTMLSIVQGIAFVGIISLGATQFSHGLNWRILEYIVSSCMVVGLWHKYVQHQQFVGWQFTILDSLFLFLFGVIEGVLVLFLGNPSTIGYVHLCVTAGFFLGTFAYSYTIYQMHQAYVYKVCENHYKARNDAIYTGILGYEYRSRFVTTLCGGIFLLIAIPSFINPQFSIWSSILSILLFIVYLAFMDLNYWLRNGKGWKSLQDIGRDNLKKSSWYAAKKSA